VHLQDLMSQGFMTAVELATCYVLEDPASLVPAEGYVVTLVVFYEGDSMCHRTDSLIHYCGITN
jgi:hypothetical protein